VLQYKHFPSTTWAVSAALLNCFCLVERRRLELRSCTFRVRVITAILTPHIGALKNPEVWYNFRGAVPYRSNIKQNFWYYLRVLELNSYIISDSASAYLVVVGLVIVKVGILVITVINHASCVGVFVRKIIVFSGATNSGASVLFVKRVVLPTYKRINSHRNQHSYCNGIISYFGTHKAIILPTWLEGIVILYPQAYLC